jgi:hypothetical protein
MNLFRLICEEHQTLQHRLHPYTLFTYTLTHIHYTLIHSSWLQIRRPGFDSPALPEKKVVGLERGPLSLVSTTEELRDRKGAAPV